MVPAVGAKSASTSPVLMVRTRAKCGLSHIMGSCPLLVIVLRSIKHTVHGLRPLKIARGHNLSRLSWYASLRGHRGRVCRRSRAGRRGGLGARRQHEATMQEIETRAAKHLPLQHFEAVDVPLDRAIGPRQGHARFDGRIVVAEPTGKAAQGLQRTCARPRQPWIQMRGLPLAHHLRKVLRQVNRLSNLDRVRVELRELLGLMVGTTVVLLPLGLLLWTQLRFLPYHDTAITWNHRLAVLVDLALLWLFWSLMFPPAPCQEPPAHGAPPG